jgi:hypothetical protein
MNKLVILSFISIFLISCKTIKTDYYLVENFKGNVAVIYGVKKGIKANIENGRLQLNIPDSGILMVSNKYVEGVIEDRFFERKSNGELKGLVVSDNGHSSSKKERVYFHRTLTFNNFHKNHILRSSYNAILFYVGEKFDSSLHKERFLFENHLNNLCQALE